MASKLKLPQESSKKLDLMSANLHLRRNIICRIAIGMSLSEVTPPEIDNSDNSGTEFNQPTIMGTDESVLKALITQHFRRKIKENEFFSIYVRAEIIRGLDMMVSDYSKINSPVRYMEQLCAIDGEYSIE